MKIILVMAITLDGKIGKHSHHFPDWTPKEDKSLFAKISKKHKVLFMGENTFDTFQKPLKDRLNVVFTRKKNQPKLKNVLWVSGKIKPVLKKIEKLGYHSAILGGGSFLNTLFLKEKLIDEIMVTIVPKIFGDGLSLFNDYFDASLKLLEIKKINEDSLVLRYKVVY